MTKQAYVGFHRIKRPLSKIRGRASAVKNVTQGPLCLLDIALDRDVNGFAARFQSAGQVRTDEALAANDGKMGGQVQCLSTLMVRSMT